MGIRVIVSQKIWSGHRLPAVATPHSLRERGSTTAELATALPAIVLIASILLDLFAAMALYLHSSQIAQRAAEAITRHEELSSIEAMVANALPTSHFEIVIQGAYSIVRIETPAPWPKSMKISASAIAHN